MLSDMGTIRVVLIDDNPSFLDSAARFVAHHPRVQVVGRASNGAEGVRLTKELGVDLVFVDLVMPDESGLDVTREITHLPKPPRVAIVTMHDDPEFRRSAIQTGADGFIPKAEFAESAFGLIDELFPEPEQPLGDASPSHGSARS
jgi:DNA-binding NarL/FixJ family response regulator